MSAEKLVLKIGLLFFLHCIRIFSAFIKNYGAQRGDSFVSSKVKQSNSSIYIDCKLKLVT